MTLAINDDAPVAASSLDTSARQARHILAMRRRRRSHFPDILFGEPGWELLLQLYVAEGERRRLSERECVALSQAPASTAARWIKLLVEEGLVAEEAEGDLSLTPEARNRLRGFLRQFAETSPPPVWRRSASRSR
jgi:hypothetical protein